jgi:hypothetical protein
VDDPATGNEGLQFEVLASSLRADLTDTGLFLGALAEKLGGALPQQCVVERKGGLFAREKPIHRVSVELGEQRYLIEKTDRGGLRAARIRVVRGIALKTEELGMDTWIDDLSRDLAAYAARNAQARGALERLLT